MDTTNVPSTNSQDALAELDNTLNDRTKEWCELLDAKLRPKVLIERFPRVANRIALLWTEPDLMRKYFEEISVNARGTRAGFPLEALTEITNLRHFYDTELHPVKTDVWYKVLTQIHE